MKTKIFILALTAFFATGCNTGTTTENTTSPVATDQEDTSTDETSIETPAETPAPVVVKKTGWYLRTTAKATLSDGTTFEHKTAGVFGELDESAEGKDKHDIASYGKAVFQVRFINDELGKDVQYFSDYRKYDGSEKKQVWTFQIKNQYKTDLSNASLQIDVEQMRDVLKKEGDPFYIEKVAKATDDKRQQLTLIDLDNQKTYTYAELKTANLSMDGSHTRTFRWVLGTVDQSDMEPLAATKSTLAVTKTADTFTTDKTTQTSTFGTPPQ